MNLKDMIVPNKDFQTSINIDFDLGDASKVRSLIPTDAVCRYIEDIVSDVVMNSNQRAKLLVGAYGKGKSHIVLAALAAMWVKDPSCFAGIIEGYKKRGLGFGDTLSQFVAEGKRLLPVIITGSTADLHHSLLYALRTALRKGGLEELMPTTNYDGAIHVLNRWRREYPETLEAFTRMTGMGAESAVSALRNLDTQAYEAFVEAYPRLTSGSSFDVLDGSDVLDVYKSVLDGLSSGGISGIYIVYDEFSKFLESNIERATIEDIRLLQDLAELCNRSGSDRQLHLLLISHKSLSNYIDSRLPKEKADGWRGVSGRFREIEMIEDAEQYYELMGSAIVKDEAKWNEWLVEGDGENAALLERLADRYVKQGLFEEASALEIVGGCFPLHPLTIYLLPRLSEKIAQNERTLFTFLCSEEDRSLNGLLASMNGFVTPDFLYDYFEPLLRKEYYTSPLHRVYELAQSSLRHVDPSSLESRIVKTVAVIDVVSQYDKVAPTRETLAALYADCGVEAHEVDAALERLVEEKSIVYLRRSNAFLKLKEPSGEPVETRLEDRAERIRIASNGPQILDALVRHKALYPARYNEDRGMIRYFSCRFVDAVALMGTGLKDLPYEGDGVVVAVHAKTADEFSELKHFMEDSAPNVPMMVVAVPKRFTEVEPALYRLEAAWQLKGEAGEDVVLAEEYEMIAEDFSEIVEEYVEGFFRPELGRSVYFSGGRRLDTVTRKRRLSEELSELCYSAYGKTPRITSEALNKDELTGAAFSSRTKILKSLCGRSIEPNLGFTGNGQETSMARSAFELTGIFRDLDSATLNPPEEIDENTRGVLLVIRKFVDEAHDNAFDELYGMLAGADGGIGLRRGPIPLYLAFVLRDYRDEISITRDGEEREFNEALLNDIAAQPGCYRLTRLNWTPNMASYLAGVAEVFGCDPSATTRRGVTEAIKLWYAGLPQMTRSCCIDHTQGGERSIDKTRAALFKAIRRFDASPDTLLFQELPKIYGLQEPCSDLVEHLREEKARCDAFLTDSIARIASELKFQFGPKASEDATLGAILREWAERNPAISTRVFSGPSAQIIRAIKQANGDDTATVQRLAKAATALRVEDWNDARFRDFYRIVAEAKSEVEGQSNTGETPSAEGSIGIVVAGADGKPLQKTFNAVECGPRSKLLKRSIIACLSEMGGALSPEEKRQVVFEVLEGLC